MGHSLHTAWESNIYTTKIHKVNLLLSLLIQYQHTHLVHMTPEFTAECRVKQMLYLATVDSRKIVCR